MRAGASTKANRTLAAGFEGILPGVPHATSLAIFTTLRERTRARRFRRLKERLRSGALRPLGQGMRMRCLSQYDDAIFG